jgi:WD40 repeat protein
MSDGSEEENQSVDSLATVFQHLGTNDIPTEAPVLAIPLRHIYDDFYHNPLDWSSQNIVSYIDQADVYIVSPSDKPQIRKVSENGNAISTKFSPDGRLLAVGTYSGVLELYDVETNQLVWENKVHDCRIGCLAWKGDDLIFTGSRDRTINANVLADKAYVQIGSHSQEVCGMRVSQSNDKLVTGGNDNMIKIWDVSKLSMDPTAADYGDEGLPLHKSAIKALDFSPTVNGVIATGGGCNDGRIFVWNVANREIFKEIEIDKQITNLHWLPSGKEIVSTYGFGWNRNHKFNIEHNSIDIWSFETLKVVQRFEGHKGRVLFSAMAPSKEGFVTAASDNQLKFWKPKH